MFLSSNPGTVILLAVCPDILLQFSETLGNRSDCPECPCAKISHGRIVGATFMVHSSLQFGDYCFKQTKIMLTKKEVTNFSVRTFPSNKIM